eukprot:SM000062S19966  [mRNA]  locus=s62:591189:596080:- [translate_table: standard]
MLHASRFLMARIQQSSGRPAQGSAAGWAVFPVHSVLPPAATYQPFQIRGLQTFLPYPDFAASIKCLDTKRLGKQEFLRQCFKSNMGKELAPCPFQPAPCSLSSSALAGFELLRCSVHYLSCLAYCCSTYAALDQRVEAYQILNIVTGKATSKAWQNHPCVRMWRGHTKALYLYYNQCLQEWSERGRNNVLLEPATIEGDVEMPPWLGNDVIHKSHRSMLLAKDAEHYGQFGWQDTPGSPYWWPVPMERNEEPMAGELKPMRKRATRAVGGIQDIKDVKAIAAERTALEKAARETRALARQHKRQTNQAGQAIRVGSSISVAVESIADLPSPQEGPSIETEQASATGKASRTLESRSLTSEHSAASAEGMAALAATASAGQVAGAWCCGGPGARLGSAQSWRLCRLFVPLPASPLGRPSWRPPPSPLGVRGLQTFLPFPDFAASVRSLDNRRLGKQRVEAFQILNVITGKAKSNAWKNSPVVRMWRGYADALALYYNECLLEWSSRGFRNVILEPVPVPVAESAEMPAWFGDEELHASHRSNLLRKDPEFYGQYRWPEATDKPYVWPVPLSPPEQVVIAASADDDTAISRLVSATLIAAAAVKPLGSEVAKANASKSSPSTRSKRRISSSTAHAADKDLLQATNHELGDTNGECRFASSEKPSQRYCSES